MPFTDPAKKKEHDAAYQKEWRQKKRDVYLAAKKRHRTKHKEARRSYRRQYALKTLYGLTEADYQAILASQNGRCAICGSTSPGGNRHSKHFHVDHNHETGAVRGLLCCECNRGLGILGDKVEIIESVLNYLRTHQGAICLKTLHHTITE